jgi:hypothetical protein
MEHIAPRINLSADEARRILGFLGYGRPSAPTWFIGLEEGLGDQDSLDHAYNLKARGTWEEVMDLERSDLLLHRKGEPMQDALRPPPTRTWRWMAKICRALAGSPDWEDKYAAEHYAPFARCRLAQREG